MKVQYRMGGFFADWWTIKKSASVVLPTDLHLVEAVHRILGCSGELGECGWELSSSVVVET